jgi:hypothetical protein
MTLPVSFKEKLREPVKVTGGYPIQIKADDLDKNFVYAALDAEEGYIQSTGGQGGHAGRKLTFPPIPQEGTHVLAAVGGALTWLATEDCD